MLDKKPNIHLFEVYDRKFLYDVDTNSIVSVPSDVYSFLRELTCCSGNSDISNKLESMDEKVKQGIMYLENQGLLHPFNDNLQIKHIETDILQELFDGNLSLMTLQVTQNCNLRCKYCVYSGSYINRTHTNKRMTWEVAKRAVDFYYEHTKNSKEVSLGFYGGEPLLEIALIRKVVEYAEELFKGKKLSFNMTTNATLFTNEIGTIILIFVTSIRRAQL